MRHTQCSKASQVVRTSSVTSFYLEHKVVQGLCVVLLCLGWIGLVACQEILDSQAASGFLVQLAQATGCIRHAAFFIAIQRRLDSDLHLLHDKGFLLTDTETRGQKL